MRITTCSLAIVVTLGLLTNLRGEVSVVAERAENGAGFRFKSVPPPAQNDAASSAQFSLVDGERDQNGAELSVLRDGQLPTSEDEPSANFFFRAGTSGGRIAIDLGKVISVKQIGAYSWHADNRGPQVFELFASDGASANFLAAPKRGTDPTTSGWRRIASVDTRPKDGAFGGQYGVLVADTTAGNLGDFRYLLLDISRTEDRDAFGNTFYSELDVLDAQGPAPTSAVAEAAANVVRTFDVEGGKYQFTIDASAAPDLEEWAYNELRPVVQEWYPKLVAMLPSEGFEPATNVTLLFRNDMRGTPASAGRKRINLNSGWFRKELKREARGSVVHEMVHIIQNYGQARRTNPDATRTPGWIVEGIPDYIRWFLYEPQTKGAEITARNIAKANYDSSYRITGNFLDWVTRNYDKEIVRKINAAARAGKYSEELWKTSTGKTIEELGQEWKKFHEARLAASPASQPETKPKN